MVAGLSRKKKSQALHVDKLSDISTPCGANRRL
jgi:hypothetical protein